MAAKGLVYGLVGTFALLAALGVGGVVRDFKGAMRLVNEQWWGKPLLVAVGIGLFAYAFWRGMQAIFDPENDHPEKPRVFKRIAYSISAAAHTSLGYFALKKAWGASDRDPDGDQSTRLWASEILSWPMGQWLILLVGVGLVAFAAFEVHVSVTGLFQKKMKTSQMSKIENHVAAVSGSIGHGARAVAFGLIGGFLIKAAFDHNVREAKGLRGVMEFLASQQFGPWLLASFSLGLIGYAVFMALQAMHRRVKTPN